MPASRGLDMRRREFITPIGGAIGLWPLVARAQQVKLPTLGILVPEEKEPFFSVFEEGLRRLGCIPGQCIQVEFPSAEGQPSRLAPLAAGHIALKVHALIGALTPVAMALKQAGNTIPIVMRSGDPVAVGLIASFARARRRSV
jgi:putative ABC transport system substrate-binding protein